MQLRFIVPVLASLTFVGAGALAQDAPQGQPMKVSDEDMAQHHAQMCDGMYAHAVGRLASLEVELKLTSAQKPLFDKWKAVRLDRAKAHSEKCAKMDLPRHGKDISIMEGFKFETAMLEARLADLKAEKPTLEALVNSLTPDQQKTFKHAALEAMHHRMGMMEHGGMMRHQRFFRNGPDKPADMPPPPHAN